MNLYTGIAACVGAAPIPGSDIATLTGLQTTMVVDLCEVYGHQAGMREAACIVASLSGGAYLARAAVRSLIKAIPGIGTIAGAVICGSVAAAGTQAFGQAALAYCRNRFGCNCA